MSVNIYNSNPNATSEEENFSRVADRGSKLASDTIYSNTTSGLNSVNVQGAIDEVNEKVDDNVKAISRINSDLTETNSDLAEFTAKNNWIIKSNTDHADVRYISVTDVNSIANKPHLVHQISGSPLSGMPSDIGTNGFVGIRFVHYFDVNNIMVELKSMAPPFTTYYARYNSAQHAWTSWYRSMPTVVS